MTLASVAVSPDLRVRSTPPRENEWLSTCQFGQVGAIPAACDPDLGRPILAGRRPCSQHGCIRPIVSAPVSRYRKSQAQAGYPLGAAFGPG